MRPIALHLHNFGPFLNEKIDFTQIDRNQLFLISGKTGSGKTMIFDSIVYALYGRASTEKREVKHLRSHFAPGNEPLSVTFEFELQNQYYKVIRKASFLKEGNKNETKPQLEIYHYQEGQYHLKESKISSGEQYLLNLLGLKQHQFRQLFILPQGEFKTFLFSNSTEKQTILRTLFNTQLFDRLKATLAEQTDRVKKEIEQQHTRLESMWQELYHLDDERLIELQQEPIVQYDTLVPKLEQFHKIGNALVTLKLKQKEIAAEHYENVDQEVIQQEKRQNSLNQHNILQAEIDQLKTRENKIKSYEEKVRLIQKSQVAIRIYEDLKELQDRHIEKDKVISILREELTKHDTQLKELEVQFEDHQKDEALIQTYQEYQRKVDYYYQNLNDIAHQFEQLRANQDNIESITGKLETLQSELKNLKQSKEKIDTNIEELSHLQQQYFELQDEKKQLEQSQSKYEKWLNLNQQVIVLKDDLNHTNEEIENLQIKQHQLSQSDTLLLNYEETIIHLKHSLHEGDECPVCGKHVEHSLDDKHLQQLKVQQQENELVQESLKPLKEKQIQLQSRIELTEEQMQEVEVFENQEGHIKKLEESLVSLNETINKMKQDIQNIKSLNISIEKLENKVSELQKDRITKEQENHHIQDLKANFEKDTDFDDLDLFKNEFENHEQQIKEFEARHQRLFEEIQQEKEHYTQQKFSLESNLNELKSNEQRIEKLKDELEGALEKLNINTIDELNQVRTDQQNEDKYREAIESYKDTLQRLTTQIESETRIIDAIEPRDLDELYEKRMNLKKELESKQKEFNEFDFQVKNNIKVADHIKSLVTNLNNALSEQVEIVHLSNVISGKNDQNLTLENYVLIYYLENILIEANKHLRGMTGQRYELIRKKQKGRGFSGLELEVFDFYSNQSRHIASLSGGETFQASLSLALGLSEIVQQEQGGVSLDCMFIDEGFGTLDQETLETAINTLIQLQSSGRLVGIISHVTELKNRMPVILEVDTKNYESTTHIKYT
ncbi:exonuclease subunit SbcC [Staphylococcus canis]|uniref:Nuclease SbcCD subunit C n=1 Tax=Staphylococcus canis TaxID=2724942 RepID=A0ABS0TAZ7_9STAP|nr:exonuclease subunit SbcC [Staphylococcus canis]MBI5975923.1 SMC family ATPase [Staphylococcus canis]